MVYKNIQLNKIVNNTPIEYLTEYQTLIDIFSKTTSQTSYVDIQTKLDSLRSKIISDISTLDDYENKTGRVYSELNLETNSENTSRVYNSTENHIYITIIGLFLLFFLLYFITNKPTTIHTTI